MMKIGLFGGSFNPIHNGHVRLAGEFRDLLGLDKILIVPANQPPHKAGTDFAPAEDRFNMCALAFTDAVYEVSDLELARGGKSYTVDTVRELKKRYPGAELYLLVGSDMLFYFDQWFCYREILELCTLCAVSRDKSEGHRAMRRYAREVLQDTEDTIVIARTEPYALTSTQIRGRIRDGKDIADCVPGAVKDYIERRGLYIG